MIDPHQFLNVCLKVYGSISTGEFTVLWKHWQAECCAKLNSRVLAAQPHLELIMKVTEHSTLNTKSYK